MPTVLTFDFERRGKKSRVGVLSPDFGRFFDVLVLHATSGLVVDGSSTGWYYFNIVADEARIVRVLRHSGDSVAPLGARDLAWICGPATPSMIAGYLGIFRHDRRVLVQLLQALPWHTFPTLPLGGVNEKDLRNGILDALGAPQHRVPLSKQHAR